MKSRWVVLSLLINLSFVYCTSVFDITQYGAIGDGEQDNTKAFLATIQACNSAGGGQVLVPEGNFLTFPFTFNENTDLHLSEGAFILAHPNPYDWPSGSKCFICAKDANNSRITGYGTVDGQGALWWANLSLSRPNLVVISDANDFLIEGVTFKDSPQFNIVPEQCNFMEIRNISILAPPSPQSHNTDGIDPSKSSNIYIHDCLIDNGDDNIAIKEDSSNLLIENCVFANGHGASIGSVVGGTNQNITFRNITFTNTAAAVRIKTQPGCTGIVRNVTYENINVEGVDDIIVFDMNYAPGCGSDPTGIQIENIRVQGITGSGNKVGYFNCSKYMPCKDIQLFNINIKGTQENSFKCNNAYGTFSEVTPTPCLMQD